ncbi:MAG: alpha-L-fucosidase [Lentimicrobium sp.]|jgi:alpha-L-fucosidase|nr:alpha-L-fucosidase [Lentimicrobium sp.]
MRKIIALYLACFSCCLHAQQKPSDQKLEWFRNARLGIFIHWGIYAVDGVTESWSFHNGEMSHSDYMKQLNGFGAEAYQPEEWARLIRQSGARYAVITSKHHDGVALWNTNMNELSVPESTPAGRDVLTPFVDALRKEDLKTGLYFSLPDWTHPDYPGFLRDSSRYAVEDDTARWAGYLQFMRGQLNELSKAYHPDLWWFDGDWEHTAEEWQAATIRQVLLNDHPDVIINGRLAGFGDYSTPEQHLPITRPDLPVWELCLTMNNSWGYQPNDTNYKSAYEIVSIFAEVVGGGGNLLLDIAPRADGSIPEEQKRLLEEMGRWINANGEAVFDTRAGLPAGHFYGPTTLSADSLSLYLFLSGRQQGPVMIKGLNNNVTKATVLGSRFSIEPKVVGKISWSKVPGLVFLEFPETAADSLLTVIRLTLDSPLSLYRGQGHFFED